MNKFICKVSCYLFIIGLSFLSGCTGIVGQDTVKTPGASGQAETLTIRDGFSREVTIPLPPEKIVCSGAGCLRYAVYLGGQDLVVGVDDIEKKNQAIEGRPYALAHGAQFKDLPLIGEYRGKDDPEKIILIQPDVIFKASTTGQPPATSAADAEKLQEKTGIPVIAFPYGSLRDEKEKGEMFDALRIMGNAIGKDARAEEIITYIDATMADLERRTADIPESQQKNVYIGGVSSAGAHGIISTEPAYPPFLWVHAKNMAAGMGTAHADIAKEALIAWDPEVIFIDVGTLQLENKGAIGELESDPALKGLDAVKNDRIYGLLPYNFYSTNYETVLANAYFVGKILYPDRFADIEPARKADEIYTFFLGKPVFSQLNSQYENLGFARIPLQE